MLFSNTWHLYDAETVIRSGAGTDRVTAGWSNHLCGCSLTSWGKHSSCSYCGPPDRWSRSNFYGMVRASGLASCPGIFNSFPCPFQLAYPQPRAKKTANSPTCNPNNIWYEFLKRINCNFAYFYSQFFPLLFITSNKDINFNFIVSTTRLSGAINVIPYAMEFKKW